MPAYLEKHEENQMRFSLLLPTLCLVCISSSLSAANITNRIHGVGPKNNEINPYFCIQNANGQMTYALAPGATVDANRYSGSPYFVGGTLRFGGCKTSDSYLGYAAFNASTQGYKFDTYNPPESVHIAYKNADINTRGDILGNIQYTPIQSNFNLLTTSPSSNPDWTFVGANLSGLEFGKTIDPFVIPNLSKEDASGTLSDLADTQALLKAGMNTMRVPLSWSYLQLEGPGQGEINQDYYNSYVKPLLQTLTHAKVYVILDLHTYMRYSVFGKEYSGCGAEGKCPDGTLILDATAYQDIWTKLYTLIKKDPDINLNYILMDLVNEPVDVPNDAVFTIQTQVIKALRQNGYTGYILVEGNAWSGLHSWLTKTWNSPDGKTTYSNATLFTRENFIKAGITDLDKIIINVHQYLDSDYSGTHDQCVTDLTTTGPEGYNLNTFVDYLQKNKFKAIVTEFGTGRERASCSQALKQFMNYLKDNSANNKEYGFIGWTIWSTGHGWGDYNLRITPTSYQMQILKNYLLPIQG